MTTYKVGDHFQLIGRATIFKVVRIYKALGTIDVVVGHTLDDKFETHARFVDVIKTEH